ncbi:winged helix-turn-helix domain-containing protein [Amaricoccus sp.]|nr:winged helix-turn-helix domain-containing protein [Amaricoccus sp.]
MGAILHRLGFTQLSARPRHPGSDAQAQELY